MNLSEEEIRSMVREMLASKGLGEHDALHPKKKDWKESSKELKSLLVDLLDNIENDDYKEGVKKINLVIKKLRDWKIKIDKFIS